MRQLGIQSLLSICGLIIFIWIGFVAIQSVDWDKILHPHSNNFGKLLIALVAVALGYLINQAFMSLLQAFQNLNLLF